MVKRELLIPGEGYAFLLSSESFSFTTKGMINNIQAMKKTMLPIKYKVSPLLILAAIKQQAHIKNKTHPNR